MKKNSLIKLFLLAISLVFYSITPQFAFANGEGIQAILPNMQEFLPMLVAFIVLCLVLGKFGWPMFEKIIDERKKSIQDDLESASKSNEEAQRLLEENRKQLNQAKEESLNIQKAAKLDAKNSSKDIIAQANMQAEEIRKKAQSSIDKQKLQAQHDLKEQVVKLSISIVEKFVSKDLNDDEHRKLIAKYVDEMEKIDA